MESLELQLDRLIGMDDDDILPMSSSPSTPARQPTSSAVGTPRNDYMGGGGGSGMNTMNGDSHGDDPATSFLSSLLSPSQPPQSNGGMMAHQQAPSPMPYHQQQQYQQQHQQQQQQFLRQPHTPQQSHSPVNQVGGQPTPGSVMMPSPKAYSPVPSSEMTPTPQPPASYPQSQQTQQPSLASTPLQLSPMLQPLTTPQTAIKIPPTTTTTSIIMQQKRLWTHTDDQPGRVTVNDVNISSPHVVLDVRPRQEISARWVISWKYLQQRAEEIAKKKFESAANSDDGDEMKLQQPILRPKDDNPLNRLLPELRLGLFRRGCAENGAQASIISKSVMVSGGGGRSPYLDAHSQMVIGTVPFYSPRTPGHVVFRLYWDDEPLYTLGVGPTLHVRVTEDDYESTIRFLLSNMKKKVNPTSLSSLHSLALVLETPMQSPQNQNRGRHQQHQQQQLYDRAGRATWGCICEARKVLDACAAEYARTSQRLSKLATTVDELKAEIEEEAKDKEDGADEEQTTATNDTSGVDSKFDDAEGDLSKGIVSKADDDAQEKDDERSQQLREKTRALMSGRASCERKWRDSQLAFASIIKVCIRNVLSNIDTLLTIAFIFCYSYCPRN